MLEERLAGSGEDPEAFHAAIVERSNLILRVQQLLQDGGFGDSCRASRESCPVAMGQTNQRKSQMELPPPSPNV